MTPEKIKDLCRTYQIRPSKGKGQNFLLDEKVIRQMIEAADLKKTDNVLEVGPGFGILTEALLGNCRKVLSIELDKKLFLFLNKKFAQKPGLEILEQDILFLKNSELAEKFSSSQYKLVANLPYAITKPLLRKFLTYEPKPELMVVLVQKEVAEKIVAKPGEMNILGLTVQFYGQPEIIAYVSNKSFYPQPKVDSAILKIRVSKKNIPLVVSKRLTDFEIKNFQEKKFWQIVKIGFSSPRKQLHNNLSAGLQLSGEKVKNIIISAGFKPEVRAQELDLADWAFFYQQLMA